MAKKKKKAAKKPAPKKKVAKKAAPKKAKKVAKKKPAAKKKVAKKAAPKKAKATKAAAAALAPMADEMTNDETDMGMNDGDLEGGQDEIGGAVAKDEFGKEEPEFENFDDEDDDYGTPASEEEEPGDDEGYF